MLKFFLNVIRDLYRYLLITIYSMIPLLANSNLASLSLKCVANNKMGPFVLNCRASVKRIHISFVLLKIKRFSVEIIAPCSRQN